MEGEGDVDFFRMMGALPMKTLESMWFENNGSFSECAEDLFNDEDEWRDRYWDTFVRDITKKSNDWEYEKEYRLIFHSSINDLSDPQRRKFTYDFRSLKGIIFGINTKTEDKVCILNIISRKCREMNRSDFKLYQAYYSSAEKCIAFDELSLIKLLPTE